MIYSTKTVSIVDGNIDGYMTVRQYANENSLSCASVRNWIRSGDIDAIIIGRSYYIPKNAVPPEFKSRGKIGKRYYFIRSYRNMDKVKLNSTSRRILECLNEHGGMTVRSIGEFIPDRNISAIYFNLKRLVDYNLVT